MAGLLTGDYQVLVQGPVRFSRPSSLRGAACGGGRRSALDVNVDVGVASREAAIWRAEQAAREELVTFGFLVVELSPHSLHSSLYRYLLLSTRFHEDRGVLLPVLLTPGQFSDAWHPRWHQSLMFTELCAVLYINDFHLSARSVPVGVFFQTACDEGTNSVNAVVRILFSQLGGFCGRFRFVV